MSGIGNPIPTQQIAKIDNAPVDGLSGVPGSLAYEVLELVTHFHNYERWIGPAAVPDGEDHIGDVLGDVLTSFQFTSGIDNLWGAGVQIFGATDAAVILPTGRQAKFDPRQVKFTDVQTTKHEWLLRILCGATVEAAIAAETYTMSPFFIDKTDKNKSSLPVPMRRCSAGDKLWAQVLNMSVATAQTLDAQFGIHGYEG